MADDSDSIFAKAGFALPTAAPAPAIAAAAPGGAGRSIFEDAGFKINSAKSAGPADDMTPTVEQALTLQKLEREGKFKNPEAKSELQRFREDFSPSYVLPKAAHYILHDTVENAVAGAAAAKQGYQEIKQGNGLPSFPSANPSSWSPGGYLRTAGGALGAVTSPISGTINAVVTRPVTEMTGNPDIGDRAGVVANALVPMKGGGRIAEAVSPANKGVNALVDAIGPENVPEAVAAMRANPRLAPVDVSDPVRVTTQGLMAGGSPEVQDFISKAVRARNATRVDAANTAFTEAMGPVPDVPAMLEGLKQRALGPDAELANSRAALDKVMGPAGDPFAEMKALRERQEAATSPQVAREALSQTMGRPVDPYDELHQMVQQRSAAAAPLYAKALDRPVVWDNRLQQFLDDPIVQRGLAQGVRIQRLESLAANEPFRPTDYAIKSFNEAGDPVIGETPNMRTLNVVKKGLDAQVQEMTDPVTGRLSQEGRAVDAVRKSFLNKLDDINPDYKAARQAWAGPSQAHDAFNRGLNIFQNRAGSSGINTTPAALSSWFSDASDAEKEAARIGARSAFEQQMQATGDPASKASALAAKGVNRQKLGILFGQDQAGRLTERLTSQYEDPIGSGFSRGLDLFQNRSGSAGVESTPEALAAWHKDASPEARQAARIGARTAIDQQMKAVTDPASTGAAIANKEVNRDKLSVLFGPGAADQIAGHLKAKFEDPIGKAFDEGFDVLKNRSGVNGLEDRPQMLAKWMQTATPEQVVAKRLGVRLDIDQKINSVRNGSLAGENITAIPYNREKLVTLFGEPEASRLIRVMEDARREATTNSALVAGSKTAETRAAVDRIKTREIGGGNPLSYVAPVAAEVLGQSAGLPFLGLAASLAGKGALMGGQKVGQMMDLARNSSFARNALATGTERERTINALLEHPKVQKELKRRLNALSAEGQQAPLLASP